MRRKRALQFGDVITIDLPGHIPSGHEQTGIRPAIVVGLPTLLGKLCVLISLPNRNQNKLRCPMLIIVPMTTVSGLWSSQSPGGRSSC